MEVFLHKFRTHDSQLIRSFWAGKMVQDLHMATEDELKAAGQSSSPPSHGQRQAEHVADALQCLVLSETSLSQKVQDILTDGEGEPPSLRGESPLLSDGTLNWSKLSRYFDASEQSLKRNPVHKLHNVVPSETCVCLPVESLRQA